MRLVGEVRRRPLSPFVPLLPFDASHSVGRYDFAMDETFPAILSKLDDDLEMLSIERSIQDVECVVDVAQWIVGVDLDGVWSAHGVFNSSVLATEFCVFVQDVVEPGVLSKDNVSSEWIDTDENDSLLTGHAQSCENSTCNLGTREQDRRTRNVPSETAFVNYAPPLVATKDDIDLMVTIADEALTIAERELASEFDAWAHELTYHDWRNRDGSARSVPQSFSPMIHDGGTDA